MPELTQAERIERLRREAPRGQWSYYEGEEIAADIAALLSRNEELEGAILKADQMLDERGFQKDGSTRTVLRGVMSSAALEAAQRESK